MRRSYRPSSWVAAGLAVTLLMIASGCSDDSSDAADPTSTRPADPTTTASVDSTTTTGADGGAPSLTDIEFLMPSALPPGWTIGHATQRIEVTVDAGGDPIEVSDYTLVFQPEDLAGRTRAESTDAGPGPWLGLNAGSNYYSTAYLELLGGEPLDLPSPGDAEVTNVDGRLKLEYQLGCCAVSLIADGLTEDELRAVAQSLNGLRYEDWRAALGDRLLVDGEAA